MFFCFCFHFIYLFLAARVFIAAGRLSLIAVSRGCSLVVVLGLLSLKWLPLLWSMGSRVYGLSSCNTWVSLCRSMRSLSGLELKPTSSELASGLLTLDLQGSQITCILILAPPLTICVTLGKLFTISTLLFAHPWQTATTRDFRYSHPSIILSC